MITNNKLATLLSSYRYGNRNVPYQKLEEAIKEALPSGKRVKASDGRWLKVNRVDGLSVNCFRSDWDHGVWYSVDELVKSVRIKL